MSFSSNGVTFNKTKWIRNRIFKFLFRGAEGVLSVLFVISLAAPMIFPQDANAALGAAKPLSYQGRLTDASGNPLGGTGTTYCMRFSVWDVGTGGTANPNQLWPLSYATPYTKTVTVTNGIFNTFVGSALSGDDDLSAFDFSSNDTTYLSVDVYSNPGASCTGGAWESLSPRQRLGSVAYARVAADVYGTALRTSPTAVKIGAGTGQATPIWLNLDWKNTATTLGANCSTVSATNGAVWYNSSGTRALACVNNLIVGIDNTNEITSLNITGNTAGTPTAVSAGAVSFAGGNNITLSQNGNAITISAGAGGGVAGIAGSGASTLVNGTLQFANANGVSFGLNGSTMTASVNPGGGAAANLSLWQQPKGALLGGVGNITNLTALTNRPFFVPVAFDGNVTLKSIALQLSRSTSGSNLFTVQYGLYTHVNSTQISLRGSCQETFSNTATASISGIRALWLTCLGTNANASTVSPGNYVLGFYFSAAATASMNYSIRGMSTANAWVLGQMYPGANIASTAVSQGRVPMFGRYSTTHAAPIAGSYAQSAILGQGSAASLQIDPVISIRNF